MLVRKRRHLAFVFALLSLSFVLILAGGARRRSAPPVTVEKVTGSATSSKPSQSNPSPAPSKTNTNDKKKEESLPKIAPYQEPVENQEPAEIAAGKKEELKDKKTEEKPLEENPLVKAERELFNTVLGLKSDLTMSSDHKGAVKDLEKIAEQAPSNSSSFAAMVLGDLNAGLLNTPFRLSVDLPKAFKYYQKAILAPFPDIGRAHYMIGFITMYHPEAVPNEYHLQMAPLPPPSTSSQEEEAEGKKEEDKDKALVVIDATQTLVRPNVPLAHLHLALAARAGNMEARVSLAMRHLRGQFTPRSCRHAAEMIRTVTEEISDTYRKGPTLAAKLSSDTVRLDHEFLDGKSVADEERDHIQYFQFAAERGQSVEAQIAMGLLTYLGAGEVPLDHHQAFQYMKQASRIYFDNRGGLVIPGDADGNALAHLGYFYLNGVGTEKDEARAVELWVKAAQKGSGGAQMRLGLCYLRGECGVTRNYREAKKYFSEAAAQEEPEALYQLAVMYESPQYGTPHIGNARLHFQRSAQAGHIVALHELAQMNLEGVGVPLSCDTGVGLMRKVLEFTALRNRSVEAYREYSRGRHARALIRYEIAADMGLLLAQRNMAFLLEHRFGISDLGVNMTEYQMQSHALYWYREAAQQDSASANLKLGDYFFYGWGTEPSFERSAAYYQVATQLRSPQAAFNLGYMHQYGLGLPQDYHLAKRYYDMAVENNPSEAKYPSFIALIWMQIEQTFKRASDTEDIRKMSQSASTILGIEWDTALIILLSAILLLAIIIRGVLRGLN